MAELFDESGITGEAEPPTLERMRERWLVAKRVIETSSELANKLEAA